MYFTVKVKSYEILADSQKEAINILLSRNSSFISDPRYENTTFKVRKKNGTKDVYIVYVYTNLEMKEAQKEFCKNCKYFHKSFYINEEYNCSRCNMKSFLKIMSDKSKISKQYYRERMKE